MSKAKSETTAVDMVNRPPHYTAGAIECIEALKAQMTAEEFRGFLRGQVAKYLWRGPHKGSQRQDYEKAAYYLKRLIEETKNDV